MFSNSENLYKHVDSWNKYKESQGTWFQAWHTEAHKEVLQELIGGKGMSPNGTSTGFGARKTWI